MLWPFYPSRISDQWAAQREKNSMEMWREAAAAERRGISLGLCGRRREGGGAPVSGFINRSLSLLSAGIPFQFLSHLKIQQGWKRKDNISVLCSSDRGDDDAAKISTP